MAGHRKGTGDREEPGGGNIKRESSLMGREGKEKKSPKAHCPQLLPRNGIDTQEA